MTHSGERPYKCEHCPKSFILKEALKQHTNRNHSENPVLELHKCPLCPKVRHFHEIKSNAIYFNIFIFISHFAIRRDLVDTCLFMLAKRSRANFARKLLTIAVLWNDTRPPFITSGLPKAKRMSRRMQKRSRQWKPDRTNRSKGDS